MPDITKTFQQTVQELRRASGSPSSSSSVSTKKTNGTSSPWLKEAHQISRTISDLRAFILTTRPAYLNLTRSILSIKKPTTESKHTLSHNDTQPSSPSSSSSSSKALQDLLSSVSKLSTLTDKDRDSIDTQSKIMMRQIKGAIEELELIENNRRKQLQQQQQPLQLLNQALSSSSSFTTLQVIDQLAQHRQGVTLYLNERLANVATLHKDQYEIRVAREMEKRESTLFKAGPLSRGISGGGGIMSQRKPTKSTMSALNQDGSVIPTTSTTTTVGASSSTNLKPLRGSGSTSVVSGYREGDGDGDEDEEDEYSSLTGARGVRVGKSGGITGGASSRSLQPQRQQQQQQHQYRDDEQQQVNEEEDDFEQGLSAQERQLLEQENESIVAQLETELQQVRQLESSMLELSAIHTTIQQHLEIQTQQTSQLFEQAQDSIKFIDAGNDQLLKAGRRNNSTRKWILFFLIVASFILLFLDWYD